MEKIRHIIFDLGQVIINVDPGAVKIKLESFGVSNADELHMKLLVAGTYHKLETGSITPAEFRETIRGIADHQLSDKEIDDAWNAMLLDIPKERVKFMTRLKSRYELYLMSNTNAIHWECYNAYFRDTYDYPGINHFFSGTWYSYLMGVRKPDPEVFRIILEEGRFDSAEVAFVDDLKENVDAAAALGILPVHLPPGREIMDLFDAEMNIKA